MSDPVSSTRLYLGNLPDNGMQSQPNTSMDGPHSLLLELAALDSRAGKHKAGDLKPLDFKHQHSG